MVQQLKANGYGWGAPLYKQLHFSQQRVYLWVAFYLLCGPFVLYSCNFLNGIEQ